MYWSTKVKTPAAHMLIERHKDEIPNLIERYGGQMALEIRFAGELRFLANNERAIQTRQIKSTYLSKQNPECRLAENIVESELDLDQTQPPRSNTQEQHWAYKKYRSITRLTHVSQNVPGPNFIQHCLLGT
jgi:hypothetical protein